MTKRSAFSIIVAAGSGNRCPGPQAKQFLSLNGEPIYLWSVKAFQETANITGIIVVGPGNDAEALVEMRARTKIFSKVIEVVAGGSSRTESVSNGVTALKHSADILPENPVLVHDGVRPLVTRELINRVLEKVGFNQVAIPTTAPTATVKKIVHGKITHTINRAETGLAQTPQGVPYGLLSQALADWLNNPATTITDEGSLIENLPQRNREQVIMVNVPGDPDNLKITFPEDLQLAEMLLSKRDKLKQGNSEATYKPRLASGFGFDVHAFTTGRKLILGGIEVPHSLGLDGHSDADVLIHALVDAILGAVGAGDIGRHFPDHDPAHKDRCSLDFLKQAMEIVKQRGFYLEAADITIVAEQPKLAPHIPAMLMTLKETLIQPCQLNIKATTSEGLGFTGRREGIAAYAVATVTAT